MLKPDSQTTTERDYDLSLKIMELTEKLLIELQRRLKVGSRRGVHLNAIPANSRYKFDLCKLQHIDENISQDFINSLLKERPLKFRISWKDNVPDLNSLFEEDQTKLIKITKSFENLINQTDAIESEKGINTFGFGFPILIRRDKSDNKLTVAPILIWSLRIKRTKEFNTWEILRNEDDPIYINEVLINHLQSDSGIEIDQISNEMLDDGLIDSGELIEICTNLTKAINTSNPENLDQIFQDKLTNISPIGSKAHYDKLPLNSTNSFIEFGGLFSIFEVQKQNIINDYNDLIKLKGHEIELNRLEGNSFQPISSVETDPSQQGVLHSIEETRNILIQGPPGTGKSQTLTAILINALENNKKTIVVCEKRTALEVLQNSLIQKGLEYQTVLIKDIIKDRKTVVDSVRDRIDNGELRKPGHNFSKEVLENIIYTADNLIKDINLKHKQLDKKLLGNKSWTDIVGEYLSEIKKNDLEHKLKFDRDQFEFTTTELEKTLSLVDSGEIKYLNYKTIENESFINPIKLYGENPFLIEDSFKEDFSIYSNELNELKSFYNKTTQEYKSKRWAEFENQSDNLAKEINTFENQYNEFSSLIEKSKIAYSNARKTELKGQESGILKIKTDFNKCFDEFKNLILKSQEQFFLLRQQEFDNQFSYITKLISEIKSIIDKNKNTELLDEKIINGFTYKFLSTFSKQKKETILKQDHIKKNLSSIVKATKKFQDLPILDFIESSLEDRIFELKKFEDQINSVSKRFQGKIDEEYKKINFKTLLELENRQQVLDELSNNLYSSDRDQNESTHHLQATFSDIKGHLNLLKGIHDSIKNEFKSSIDFTFTFSDSNTSFRQHYVEVNSIDEYISQKKKVFENSVDNEFNKFQLSEIIEVNSFQEKIDEFDGVIKELKNSFECQSVLLKIKAELLSHFSSLDKFSVNIQKTLSESRDLNKVTYKDCLSFFDKLKEYKNIQIDKIKEGFPLLIEEEFKHLNLHTQSPDNIELNSIAQLQKKSQSITNKIISDNWLIKKINSDSIHQQISLIESLLNRYTEYYNNPEDLFSIEFGWHQFYNELSDNQKKIINSLKLFKNWKKVFLINYLNSLLVNSASIHLPMDDSQHLKLSDALKDIGKEQLKYIKENWLNKQYSSKKDFEQRHQNLSLENLYNKRSSNKFKRLSLRKIVQYDATLFTNFFPIILTSPDVASNLFKGMNGYFDIVMFDEASQLKLEDNLPAILKGKQIIIAGDEHQMPPSNYFSKVFDGVIEDEEEFEEDEIVIDRDNMLLSCESLLDFASELGFKKKHLDFHYRSRHPYLIDFSNYAFYNQRLKPLPNTFDYIPIKYVQVDGTFSDSTNELEAEAVLSIIDKNINRLPNGDYPSVGIATFNISQRNLIKSKILERQKFSKYDDFNSKISELEENGLFVKNLENIQGDERDVIILSTTYGKSKDNIFSQRFGQINHSKGYKLLNVIITRAKYKIYVCSSIPVDKLISYKDYLVTEGNNKKAVLYAYLAYCKAVSENDEETRISILTTLAENTNVSVNNENINGDLLESPFEEEVYQYLIKEIDSKKLTPQLQYAGFRIDLVYDSNIPGVPKIAIECDGAKYHSSEEAYLHDRHRQKILESHGFIFHRIWSTNWWRNPIRELNKLLSFIEETESNNSFEHKESLNFAQAFTDDTNSVTELYESTNERNNDIESGIIELISNQGKIKISNVSVIKSESCVKVKYSNSGKTISLQILPQDKLNLIKSQRYQSVKLDSPLAASLLGHSKGDIIKIGDLDNFVEIIDVLN